MTDDAQLLAEQCGTSVHATEALLYNRQEQKIKHLEVLILLMHLGLMYLIQVLCKHGSMILILLNHQVLMYQEQILCERALADGQPRSLDLPAWVG